MVDPVVLPDSLLDSPRIEGLGLKLKVVVCIRLRYQIQKIRWETTTSDKQKVSLEGCSSQTLLQIYFLTITAVASSLVARLFQSTLIEINYT